MDDKPLTATPVAAETDAMPAPQAQPTPPADLVGGVLPLIGMLVMQHPLAARAGEVLALAVQATQADPPGPLAEIAVVDRYKAVVDLLTMVQPESMLANASRVVGSQAIASGLRVHLQIVSSSTLAMTIISKSLDKWFASKAGLCPIHGYQLQGNVCPECVHEAHVAARHAQVQARLDSLS
jgi:hypothetical protein